MSLQGNDWMETPLSDTRYFRIVGSGVDAWVGKKNFLSTKSVQGTKIVSIESEINFVNRPTRANMQPRVGRVAFAKMKDTLKVLVVKEELEKRYILSTGFALVEPDIESNYLHQFFQSHEFNIQKNRYAEGSTQQAISQDDYDKLVISFPASSEEQKQVADILDTVDETIEGTEKLIEKLRRVRVGVVQDLVGKINETAERKPLGTLRSYITSGSRGWAKYYADEGALFLRIGNLTRENIGLRFDDVVYVKPPQDGEGSRTKVKANDVLISITADLGIVALVPEGLGDAYVNQHIALLRFSDTETLAPWIALYLSSNEGQKQFTLLNDGGTKASLNLPTLDSIKVPVPSKGEMDTVIQTIAALDDAIAKERIQKGKLEALKTGLMSDLLTGKVRITGLLKD